jgi:endo-1,4-beta-D-glucanase Y
MQLSNAFAIGSLAGLLLCSNASAVLEIANTQPKVSAAQWKSVLDSAWIGIKTRNIAPYTVCPGLVHRPKSETPGDAVSEGVGYGMIVALFENDQATFNTIWEAGNTYLWSSNHYDWYIGPTGSKNGNSGAATDAEEDIALALIFADKLVEKGYWSAYSSASRGNYAAQAQTILNAMWSSSEITSAGTLAPGAGWGGDNFVNPGYFSPAWYRIFKSFDTNTSHDWDKVIDRSYAIIANSPGYLYGLMPDWMTPDGAYTSGQGYNSYLSGKAMFKDAIRTLWRIAIDAIWFDESRAKAYLENALAFIDSKGGAAAANYYQIEGDNLGLLVPAGDRWMEFNGGSDTTTWRYRREHSHLTIAMWTTVAMAVGTDEDKKAFSAELAKYYERDSAATFFGLIQDTTGGLEDTLHNEMYFDQFLAWFGASLMSGTFTNVVGNLDSPKTNTEGIVYDPFPDAIPAARNLARTALTAQYAEGSVLLIAPSSWKETSWQVWNIRGEIIAGGAGESFTMSASQYGRGVFLVTAESASGKASRKVMLQ